MDKRGISPVIVTILIISLAVGLGIAIMNLGKAYVQEEAQCPIAIGLTAAVINEQQQFCYNKNKKEVQFTDGKSGERIGKFILKVLNA